MEFFNLNPSNQNSLVVVCARIMWLSSCLVLLCLCTCAPSLAWSSTPPLSLAWQTDLPGFASPSVQAPSFSLFGPPVVTISITETPSVDSPRHLVGLSLNDGGLLWNSTGLKVKDGDQTHILPFISSGAMGKDHIVVDVLALDITFSYQAFAILNPKVIYQCHSLMNRIITEILLTQPTLHRQARSRPCKRQRQFKLQ